MSDSLRPHGLYSPWNSAGQNTGVGSLSLLQGIFPTQGSNPGLPHCRGILYQLSHNGSLRIQEWVKLKDEVERVTLTSASGQRFIFHRYSDDSKAIILESFHAATSLGKMEKIQ